MRRQEQYPRTTLLAVTVLVATLAYVIFNQVPKDFDAPVAVEVGYEKADVQDAIDLFWGK